MRRGSREGVGGRLIRRMRAYPLMSLSALAGLAAVVYFGAGALVVTEPEQIERTMDALIDAVSDSDVDALLRQVSPYFHEGTIDNRWLVQNADDVLSNIDIRVRSWRFEFLDVDTNVALGEVSVSVAVGGPYSGRPVGSRWEVRFEKLDERWFLSGAEPRSIGAWERPSLEELIRRAGTAEWR